MPHAFEMGNSIDFIGEAEMLCNYVGGGAPPSGTMVTLTDNGAGGGFRVEMAGPSQDQHVEGVGSITFNNEAQTASIYWTAPNTGIYHLTLTNSIGLPTVNFDRGVQDQIPVVTSPDSITFNSGQTVHINFGFPFASGTPVVIEQLGDSQTVLWTGKTGEHGMISADVVLQPLYGPQNFDAYLRVRNESDTYDADTQTLQLTGGQLPDVLGVHLVSDDLPYINGDYMMTWSTLNARWELILADALGVGGGGHTVTLYMSFSSDPFWNIECSVDNGEAGNTGTIHVAGGFGAPIQFAWDNLVSSSPQPMSDATMVFCPIQAGILSGEAIGRNATHLSWTPMPTGTKGATYAVERRLESDALNGFTQIGTTNARNYVDHLSTSPAEPMIYRIKYMKADNTAIYCYSNAATSDMPRWKKRDLGITESAAVSILKNLKLYGGNLAAYTVQPG